MDHPIVGREDTEFINFVSEDGGTHPVENFVIENESSSIDNWCGHDNRAVGQRERETASKSLSYAAVCSGIAEAKQDEQTRSSRLGAPTFCSSEKLNEQPFQSDASFKRHSITESKINSRPEDMLSGQGSWKPIEVNNVRAAKRALKNSLGAR